jgi:hypothetical protein
MSIDTPLPARIAPKLPVDVDPELDASMMHDPGLIEMPHRLLNLFPYPKTFALGLFSGGSSLLAAAMDERAIAIAMSLMAFGAVVAQPAMRAYDKYRERKREADALDRQAVTDEYLVVVRSNDERGREIETLKQMVARLEAQNTDQQKQIDKFRKGAGKAVKQLNEKVKENADRIATVEAQQGSTSNLELPATPVDVK